MKTSKTMTNPEIAELLRDVAAAYQLKDSNKYKFQIIAYQRAADAVEHATSELRSLWEEGKMDEVSGIGKSIGEHMAEIFETGRSKHFEDLTKDIPPVVFEMMKIPGIGVKTAMKLVENLKIKSLDDLKKAAQSGKISSLENFGEESQAKILKSLEEFKNKAPSRMLLPYASEIAEEVILWMKKIKEVEKIDPLGSLRRQVATIGDIDLSVASDNPQKVIDHFTKYPKSTRTIEKGDRTAAILLPSNIRIDLMVSKVNAYGSLLQHFTGSKHHNVALREMALKQNLSLSDYGIYKVRAGKKTLMEIPTEEEFYKYLKMDWIPPEIREDEGEIKASLDHNLPKLVELKDVRGDLHIHSDFDIETSHDLGTSSMKDLVKKANDLGYEYIAFSEHNPSKSKHSQKEIIDLLKKKKEEVEKLNYSIVKDMKIRGFKVFNSLEIDILPNGELPVPPEGLETLDFALVSIHSSFSLSKDKMTQRVLKALDYPKVKIFAHPTARKLNERPSVELDWNKIFEKVKEKNIFLEINADTARLDIPDTLVHEAVNRGILLTIDTDTHFIDSMDNMKWGVSVARRGWAEAKDIANTKGMIEFAKLL